MNRQLYEMHVLNRLVVQESSPSRILRRLSVENTPNWSRWQSFRPTEGSELKLQGLSICLYVCRYTCVRACVYVCACALTAKPPDYPSVRLSASPDIPCLALDWHGLAWPAANLRSSLSIFRDMCCRCSRHSSHRNGCFEYHQPLLGCGI